MRRKYRNAFNELKALGCPVIERPEGDRDGAFVISGESNCDKVWADYWEPAFGLFGVNMDVVNVLRKHGLHAEWINPGCVGVYE